MWDPLAEVQTAVLSNGLTIYCSYWPLRAFEIVECIVHSGADQDPEGKEGLAHFVEHMVVGNGAEPHVQTEDFFRKYGDRVNYGSTNSSVTKYGFCLPTDPSVLSEALDRFGSSLFGAKLVHKIESERQIILAEFRRMFPSNKSWKNFVKNRGLLTRDGKLWRMQHTLGTESSIQSISLSDLQAFYDSHYTPSNMSIVCSGGVTLAELVSLFETSPFAKQISGTRTPLFPLVKEVGEYTVQREIKNVSETNSVAERTSCGFETRGLIPGTVLQKAVWQLRNLLEKRLSHELRESSQLVYRVNVSVFSIYDAYHQFMISCEGIETSAIDRVEELVDRTIATVREHEDLFLQQRHTMRSGRMYFDPTAEGILKDVVGNLSMYQRNRTLAEDHAAMDVVTFQDILDIIPLLTPEKRWTKITRP